MAFAIPEFPITCNTWGWGTVAAGFTVQFNDARPPLPDPYLADQPCNLAWGRRTSSLQGLNYFPQSTLLMTLLLPALTDIRSPVILGYPDLVEVPAGSGRLYLCIDVDDIGKGFPNEHRAAVLSAFGWLQVWTDGQTSTTYYGAGWPGPIP